MQYVYISLQVITHCIAMKNKAVEQIQKQTNKKRGKIDANVPANSIPSKIRAGQLLNKKAVVTVKDIVSAKMSRNLLANMAKDGQLVCIKPGVYESTQRELSEFESFIDISVQAPKAVITLLSALQFHEITTENPHKIWVAFARSQRVPKIKYPPMRSFLYSEKAYLYGVEHYEAQGVSFKVYSVAKTIADCFKYRNKIGLDVAIDALKEGLKSKKTTNNDIWEAAKVCRVQNIIRPYMEAI